MPSPRLRANSFTTPRKFAILYVVSFSRTLKTRQNYLPQRVTRHHKNRKFNTFKGVAAERNPFGG
ncbi:hypothetical protein [Moorena sp. SIO3B2]|uniref:hypothetical protein n=1 Tax=Moorena sp. SIO3B2 TaxID=2607827 RepID=UPI0013B7DB2C|nr:hypothetical protein [Moorena sp. SIO3B2]NEQ10406.1 hypothetical protein [Moorena sp. SIO4E2]